MKLLVVLLCLLSERFLIHTLAKRRFSWFKDYYLFIKDRTASYSFFANPWVQLVVLIVPLVAVISLIYFLLHALLFGFFSLIFSIVIFLYCLGPKNAFYPLTSDDGNSLNIPITAKIYFIMVNRQLFAPIFWYIIAGPIFVLTYRLITICCDINSVTLPANKLADLLEWLPARMTALLYLLVGDFQESIKTFKRLFIARPQYNHLLLSECGSSAVRNHEINDMPLQIAEDLVEHAIILMLVFIAIFTLAAWL